MQNRVTNKMSLVICQFSWSVDVSCACCVSYCIMFSSGMSEGFLSWYVFITCWILMFRIQDVCIKFCEKITKVVIEIYLLIHVVFSDASLI